MISYKKKNCNILGKPLTKRNAQKLKYMDDAGVETLQVTL
jgi:hypothetical protein